MNAEHTVQAPPLWLLVLRSVYPSPPDIAAVGKLVATDSCVGRSVDAGIAQMERALEVVAIGVPNLAIANGPCQLLQDGVAPLPAALVYKLRADELHIVAVAADNTVAHIRLCAFDFHLLTHFDAECFAARPQVKLLTIVGFYNRA